MLPSSFFIESAMNKRRDLNIQKAEILKNRSKGGKFLRLKAKGDGRFALNFMLKIWNFE